MKIKAGYLLREVAGETIVVPVGIEAVNFNGIITLNKTGKVLWMKLTEECDILALTEALIDQFEVDQKIADNDVKGFLNKLRNHSLLIE
jgi:hypothetical protein